MTWNHRVVKRVHRYKNHEGKRRQETYYQVEEAFYTGKSKTKPTLFTDGKIVHGESIASLRWTLEHMLKALDNPIVDAETYKFPGGK